MTAGERAALYAVAVIIGFAMVAFAIATTVQPHYVYRHTRARTRTYTRVLRPSQHCAADGGARFAFATSNDNNNDTPYIAVVCSDGALYTQEVP